jgi:hypothetical protein
MRHGRLAAAVAGMVMVAGAASAGAAAQTSVVAPVRPGFGTPVYVDDELSGGEPGVLASTKTGTLVYTAHEGTSLLYRDGVAGSPEGDKDFAVNYRNQVNIWTSDDGGVNWHRTNYQDTGFSTDPAANTGFSDPDLTQDAGGIIYNTGIDLANDSLFSSFDGGHTWDTGTPYCHDGDRPWLAGGSTGEVFLATDTVESGHEVFRSTDAGQSCDQQGIPDQGTVPDGRSYAGDGKLYYDRGDLIEPILVSDSGSDPVEEGGQGQVGLGVSVLSNAAQAYQPNSQATFVPHVAVPNTTMKAHWPSIAVDRAGTIYLVWDTDDRAPGTTGGCDGAETPLANAVKMTYSTDRGRTWSIPHTIARTGTTVLWPWATAGSAGNVSVAWYQYDRVVDPDCATSGNVSVYAANIFGATSSQPQVSVVNASGRTVHQGGICQGGTTCVVTGQDRRLGDYFTNSTDARGCVIIAASDTMQTDPATGGPLPTSRPLYLEQNSGRSLTGGDCSTG